MINAFADLINIAVVAAESVVVFVLEARDLKPMDADGTSDPYCEVWMEGRKSGKKTSKRTTPTLFKDLHPVWNARFAFGIESSIEDLETCQFQVLDHDDLGLDDVIGVVSVSLGDLYRSPSNAIQGWAPLLHPKTGKGGLGALRVHMELESAGQSSMGIQHNAARAAACRPFKQQEVSQTITIGSINRLIKSVRSLNSLEPDQLKTCLKRHVYNQGEDIAMQGEPAEGLFWIEV